MMSSVGGSKDPEDLGDEAVGRELKDALRQLAEAQALAHFGSWEWDVPSNKVAWSEELYRIYGLDSASFDATYEGFLEAVHPDDVEFVSAEIGRAYNDHAPFTFIHRIVRPDGEVRTLRARGQVFADEDGNILRMTGTGQDVTEQVRAEEDRLRLAEAEHRHKQALQLNDEIVQGLSVARMALDLGQSDKVNEAVTDTLRNARVIITGLLESLHDRPLAAGDLVRRDPE